MNQLNHELNIIKAKNITKKYEIAESDTFLKALDDISLSIDKGDFIAIMGKSGSGKTTLLNILSTIDIQTSGQVYIYDTEIRKLEEFKLTEFRHNHLGFIFQTPNLLKRDTIYENIALSLSMASVSEIKIKQQINIITKQLGIESILKKYPSECSGGQLQRVTIARALVRNPEIIFADEPTGNLDSKTSKQLMELFQELNDAGKIIVMVTHDCYIASFSKKVLYLKDGKIINQLEKGSVSQKEYFDSIVDLLFKEDES